MKKLLFLLAVLLFEKFEAQNGYSFLSTTNLGISGNVIYSLVDHVGNFWASVNSYSGNQTELITYNRKSGSWTVFNNLSSPALVATRINCLNEDAAGNIWIGTNTGLAKYDGSGFSYYTVTDGLPCNVVNSLASIGNTLFMGTDSGVCRYNAGVFTNYTLANGLIPVDKITYVNAENATTLWLSSSNTLIRFNLAGNLNNTSYQALPALNGTIFGIYTDAAGMKWLSTSAGVYRFDNFQFSDLHTLYPDFIGADLNYVYSVLSTGPNNGVLFSVKSLLQKSNPDCMVEFLPAGKYHVYFLNDSLSMNLNAAYGQNGRTYLYGLAPTGVTANPISLRLYAFNAGEYNGLCRGPFGAIDQNSYKYLDINRVKAGITNRGTMHGTNAGAAYEVPVGSQTHGGDGAGIWMTGTDPDGNLHLAGKTWLENGQEFYPGPLDTITANIDSSTAEMYNNIWKVSYTDINNFINEFNLGHVPQMYVPTPDILNWPAKGNGPYSRNLAPFVDVNQNGIYDPLVGGDYPKIKGDQALYMIFNDQFSAHHETNGLPFGIEVHLMAYAYGCANSLKGRNELAYTTFYEYKVYNRSSTDYRNVYFGFWSDTDIGCCEDDYAGF